MARHLNIQPNGRQRIRSRQLERLEPPIPTDFRRLVVADPLRNRRRGGRRRFRSQTLTLNRRTMLHSGKGASVENL
jgi:hypothetical protein